MNRTRPASQPKAEVPGLEIRFEAGHFESSPHDTAHALFAPLHYEPGYAYPLILWLHGTGADERNLLRIMPLVSMRNYVAIAPRGSLTCGSGENQGGYAWLQSDEHFATAEQRVFDCMAIARQKLNVANHRIFVAGFDSGGTMALRIALNHPERFAGVLSLGGAFPTGQNVLRNLSAARRVPIFLAVGRDSQVYLPAAVCQDLRLLHAAGLSTTLRQYPCGHELSPQMLSDVDRWVIEQMTATGSSQVPSTSQLGQPE